jgi:hypothetical protein
MVQPVSSIMPSLASILLLIALLGIGSPALRPAVSAAEPAGRTEPGADLFTHRAPVEIAIELDPANTASLRKDPRRKVRATVKEGGRIYQNVAVHLKGASGSFRNFDDKPGLTLNFQYFVPDQNFHGLRKILLNNSVQYPSYMNEALAGQLFREAGVPAPRTGHALVQINGRKLGLYVLKEGFSKDFLRLYFKETDGNLYDINQGSYDLGSGNDLQRRFRLDEGRQPQPLSDLSALVAACQERDLDRRWERLQTTLDIRRFLSFMAMEIITCHCDGYSVYGHNFRLYHDPETHTLVFMPNDLDRMFEQCRPSILHPGFSALVSKALYETPQGREAYTNRCTWLATQVFNLEKLNRQVDQLAQMLRPALSEASDLERAKFDAREKLLREHLKQRSAAINKELAAAQTDAATPPARPAR